MLSLIIEMLMLRLRSEAFEPFAKVFLLRRAALRLSSSRRNLTCLQVLLLFIITANHLPNFISIDYRE